MMIVVPGDMAQIRCPRNAALLTTRVPRPLLIVALSQILAGEHYAPLATIFSC